MSSGDIILFLLILFPVAAGVGILSSYVLRNIFRGALKQAPLQAPDKDVEIERIRSKDRAEARALYERVLRGKLDVIKEALAMGYSQQDIRELDVRLEALIGTEKLRSLLESPDAPVPAITAELLDVDLSREIENLKPQKEKQQS